MSSPHLDDDSFSVDFSSELQAAFDFGGFELSGGSLFSFGTVPPFRSLSRVTWGCAIEIFVAARSEKECQKVLLVSWIFKTGDHPRYDA